MTFTLEILHASDQEAGIPALQDAIGLSAVMNALEADPLYNNTLKLTSGDLFIAGPFFNASRDIYDNATNNRPADSPGIADILIQNELGWNAATIGNHEFDAGSSTFFNLLAPNPNLKNGAGGGQGIGANGYSGALFPYLSNNLDFSQASLPNGLKVVENGGAPQSNSLTGSVVINVNGQSIGVIGAVTPYLPTIANISPVTMKTPLTTQADSAQVQAQRLAENLQPEVDALTAKGINKIILMTHLQEAGIEQALAQSSLRNVDVIIGGGSHRVMADEGTSLRNDETQVPPQLLQPYPQIFQNQTQQNVYYVNTGANYRYLSRLIANFDDNGAITSVGDQSGTYATDIAGVDRVYPQSITTFEGVKQIADPQIVSIIEGVGNYVAQQDSIIYGNTGVFLNGIRGDVRTRETNLGNLTADANLWYAEQYGFNIDVSMKNGGGIRDQIGLSFINAGNNQLIQTPPPANLAAGKKEGDISKLDISNSLRFDNDLAVATITAAGLKNIAEHMVARTSPGNTPGQFGQIGGFKYSYDLNGQAIAFANNAVSQPGTRIRNLAVTKDDGSLDVVVRDGQILGNLDRNFNVVILSFLATGGDGYPAFEFKNVQSLKGLTPPPNLNKASQLVAGGEQDALAEYLALFHNNSARAYRQADKPINQSERVQSLEVRQDAVLTPPAQSAIFNYERSVKAGFLSPRNDTNITVGGLPIDRLFDETYYRSQNPDVAGAISAGIFSNGLEHFINFGQFEKRNPSTLYNESFYVAQNPDVAAAVTSGGFKSGFQHYINFGQSEVRSPSNLFDEFIYRITYNDVTDAIAGGVFKSGFQHYLEFGSDEARLPRLSLYNEAYYLSRNPDVAGAVNGGIFPDGFSHYISFGQSERRDPSSLFSENNYLGLNPDVNNAVNSGEFQSGFHHYVIHGRQENRLIFG
ncbi:MAG: hypothetical protein N5P05_000364 [Chroococcopsis gigantea SAG 12.99]|jgi:2',3'-cyclic-nucleotide 2'-phosphodiesterase/3'-nucleotidase/5'-nucleotidase|nr:hypothetical protein [Chroococcopsis gigantea SAG 12.99]